MKRILVILAVLGVLFLILPVSNLIVGAPVSRLAMASTGDPEYDAALDVLGTKCVNCHTSEYQLPFYAKLPIAKSLVESDIEAGTSAMNFLEEIRPDDAQPAGEVVLAKTERAFLDGSMPPTKYLLLHWDGGVSDSERDAVISWIKSTRKANYSTPGTAEEFATGVIQPLPREVEADPKKAALGNRLFHDERLSKDDTVSCASCHSLMTGGCDQMQFSLGVGGEVGGINSPTVLNSGFQFLQFWDGRAADLVEQADGPVNNPIEMASNWPDSIAKLTKDAEFAAEFKAVYPEGFSKETITDAIAEFEKTLVTPNCALDRFLYGAENALTAAENDGYTLFIDKGCATCHVGRLLGGQSFEKMGSKADYFADRGDETDADHGRYNVTKMEKDRYRLKVPTLRNIEHTHPYLHDGSTSDLAEVVTIMSKYQLGETLTEAEVESLVAFLKALTGELSVKPAR